MSVDLGMLLVALLIVGVLVGALVGWVLLVSSEGPRMRFPGARVLWLAFFVTAPVLACILWVVVPRIEDAHERRAAPERPRRWARPQEPARDETPGDDEPRVIRRG